MKIVMIIVVISSFFPSSDAHFDPKNEENSVYK